MWQGRVGDHSPYADSRDLPSGEDIPELVVGDGPGSLAVCRGPRSKVAIVTLAVKGARLLLSVIDRGLAGAAVRAFPPRELPRSA